MTSIVKAEEKDYELLATIGGRSLIESHGKSAAPSIMEAYVNKSFSPPMAKQELENENNIFHFIYYNNQPAGYSKIIYNTPHEAIPQQQATKLERIYLLQGFYGLKLGLELFQYNLELSKQHDQVGMWLQVWKENHRAISFYQKVGFQIVGDGWFKLTDTHSNPNYIMYLAY